MSRLEDGLKEARFEIAGPDVVAEDFGGEIVVLNLSNGKYFSFPANSAAIWRDLAAGLSPAVLLGLADAAGAAVGAAVERIVSACVAEGLLRPRAAPVERESPETAFAGEAVLPMMEAYDDMADLIMADPVHDVDEAEGWPVKRDDLPGA